MKFDVIIESRRLLLSFLIFSPRFVSEFAFLLTFQKPHLRDLAIKITFPANSSVKGFEGDVTSSPYALRTRAFLGPSRERSRFFEFARGEGRFSAVASGCCPPGKVGRAGAGFSRPCPRME